MNYLLSGLLLFSILCLITVFWQTIHLKRRLDQYTRALEKINTGNLSASDMPVDQPGLEILSNLVHSLYIKQTDQLAGLQSEFDRLQATLNQITDGVLIVDNPGRISMANPAAISLFGEGDELVGKTVSLALRHHLLIETWRKCQQTNEVTSESVELPGSKIFLQMIAIPDEHAGGALLLIQDLTRIRRLEKVRRDFISNVSHELRTPLASLKALAETLQEGALDDPPAAKRFLGRMLTEVDALTQMASELLELSRIESGQVPLDKKTIQPCTLLQQAADRMKMQVERAGLELFVECPADLPPLLADMPRLEQVLVNLLHNSVKFTPAGGRIDVIAVKEQRAIHFSVRDSGVGIPADDLPRIFERFYRVDRSRTGGGTGLGLSIAKHLVEAHGGRIWAESREGNGSTFTFSIPVNI